jgi:SAM-dependent methyltransferase
MYHGFIPSSVFFLFFGRGGIVDPVDRFSNRVSDYSKYRPGYPAGLLRLLSSECGLTPASVVADVGSGTGKLTELFLSNGNAVFAVEPNRPMREEAERLLSGRKGFQSVAGKAEDTGLDPASVDMVAAGQAFHWFDPVGAAAEFRRILRQDGWVVLVWNDRVESDSHFLAEYDSFLEEYSIDYRETSRKSRLSPEKFRSFFGGEYREEGLLNPQSIDFDGLLGRYLSASYALTRVHPRFPEALRVLKEVFDRHAGSGRLDFPYRTRVIFSTIRTLPGPCRR